MQVSIDAQALRLCTCDFLSGADAVTGAYFSLEAKDAQSPRASTKQLRALILELADRCMDNAAAAAASAASSPRSSQPDRRQWPSSGGSTPLSGRSTWTAHPVLGSVTPQSQLAKCPDRRRSRRSRI